jgi:VanZ family protein
MQLLVERSFLSDRRAYLFLLVCEYFKDAAIFYMEPCLVDPKKPFDLIAIAITIVILAASFAPAPEFNAGQGSDKIFHVIAYGLLSFFAVIQRRSCRSVLIIMITIILFSGAIEALQPFTGRSREITDLLANALGTLIGGLVFWLLDGIRPIGRE